MPNANTALRVAEAPGTINKFIAAGHSALGGAADWLAATAAQEYARQQGWSDEAQSIAGALATQGRTAANRFVFSPFARLWGRPDAGERFDTHMRVSDTTPTAGTVGGPSITAIETGLGSVPGLKGSIKSAQSAQNEAIAEHFNQANTRLSPDATRVQDAGPDSMRATGGEVKRNAQAVQHFGESALGEQSDAIEAEIDPNRRLDATPVINAAENLATDPNAHPDVQAAGRAILDSLNDSRNVDHNGTISFDALKTQRTDLKTTLQKAFPAITGDPTLHPTIGAAARTVENAMTAALNQAAHDAGAARGDPTLGPRWEQNDADWKTNAQTQRGLSDFGGNVNRPVQTNLADQTFSNAPSDQGAANQLKTAVLQGDQPVIDALHEHLSPGDARSAVAETLAATGRPAAAGASGEFRPDLMGNEVGKALGPPGRRSALFDYITRQAPGAAQDMSDAAAAGRQTGRARTAEGLGETLGAVQSAIEEAKGPRRLLWAPVTTMLEDPSFVRALSGRSLTSKTIPPLVQQYAMRAGQGAIPQPPAVTKSIGGLVKAAPQVGQALYGAAKSVPETITGMIRAR
jgi:hypothetical protein